MVSAGLLGGRFLMMMMIDGGSTGILELLFILTYYGISYLWP